MPKEFYFSRVATFRRVRKKSPALCGAFSYLLVPEPGPVGDRVEPLGELFGPSVLPDGLAVLFPAPPGPGLPVFVEVPVVVPVPAVPPAAELPPAVPPAEPPPAPPLWASARVLVSASAPASAIVVSFIGFPFMRGGTTTFLATRSHENRLQRDRSRQTARMRGLTRHQSSPVASVRLGGEIAYGFGV